MPRGYALAACKGQAKDSCKLTLPHTIPQAFRGLASWWTVRPVASLPRFIFLQSIRSESYSTSFPTFLARISLCFVIRYFESFSVHVQIAADPYPKKNAQSFLEAENAFVPEMPAL